eukprot:897667-Rhodomonas_salina.2
MPLRCTMSGTDRLRFYQVLCIAEKPSGSTRTSAVAAYATRGTAVANAIPLAVYGTAMAFGVWHPATCPQLPHTESLYGVCGVPVANILAEIMSGGHMTLCPTRPLRDVRPEADAELSGWDGPYVQVPAYGCEIKHKKTQSEYRLYQECVSVYLISGCMGLLRAVRYQCRPCRVLRVWHRPYRMLWVCYALSGTGIDHTGVVLRVCYAQSGTELGMALPDCMTSTRTSLRPKHVARSRSRVSGTEGVLTYFAVSRADVLYVLCCVQYRRVVCAMLSPDVSYVRCDRDWAFALAGLRRAYGTGPGQYHAPTRRFTLVPALTIKLHAGTGTDEHGATRSFISVQVLIRMVLRVAHIGASTDVRAMLLFMEAMLLFVEVLLPFMETVLPFMDQCVLSAAVYADCVAIWMRYRYLWKECCYLWRQRCRVWRQN